MTVRLQPIYENQADDWKIKQPLEKVWRGLKVIVIAGVSGIVAVVYSLYELAVHVKDVTHDKFSKESTQQLEEMARKRGLDSIVNKIKKIPSLNQRCLLRRLSRCKEREVKILSYLDVNFYFTTYDLHEMLLGANIRLNDEGRSYHMWAHMAKAEPRISSHPSNGQQYSIQGTLVRELLFSAIIDSGKTYTWFQLENSPFSFGSITRHMIDYIKYKLSGANQGPYGTSPITDLHPLLIQPRD